MTEVLTGPQLLIRLKVEDALTGAGLPNARVVCSIRSGNGVFYPSPFSLKSAGNGWFVMAMSHLVLAARLRLGVTTRFRFEVSQFGYQPGEEVLLISSADFTLVTEDMPLGDVTVRNKRIAGAPFESRLALAPHPVRLAGQVIRDDDPAEPVVGAEVRLNDLAAGAQTTDAFGRFLFDALPLAQTVNVSASEGDASSSTNHLIDFNKSTNHVTLSIMTHTTD